MTSLTIATNPITRQHLIQQHLLRPMRLWLPLTAWLFLTPFCTHAQISLEAIPTQVKSEIPAPDIDAKSWLIADYGTGWILASEHADLRIEPASLTKLMTSYLVFDALAGQEIALEDQVYVSKNAWKTAGSRMFIQVDTQVSILELLQGLIIQSGNDAAVALAEHIAGTEEAFAAKMNLMAAKLGMTDSNFTNSSGLPDDNHYSSARDMAILSISLIRRFPDLYQYYSVLEYTYNDITQPNRNVLLSRDASVDGLKTGYTKNAGYCLIGTAVRDGVRMLAIVTGAKSQSARANQVQSLLQFGYGAYSGMVVFTPADTVKTLPLWLGDASDASVGVAEDLNILFPKGHRNKMSATLNLPESLEAPLQEGTKVGSIAVKYDDVAVLSAPLSVKQTHQSGGWFSQLIDSFRRLI